MKNTIVIFQLILLCIGFTSQAQNKPDNVCYISNDRIYFQLDKRWNEAEKKEFSELFSLDSILLQKAFTTVGTFEYDSIAWEVSSLNSNLIELSRQLNTSFSPDLTNDVILRDDGFPGKPVIRRPVINFRISMGPPEKFGLNRFYDESAFSYKNQTARFFLSGNRNARHVYLSGSFNNWSTMQLPLTKTDNGWVASIVLKPGKYLYKYIIDGQWTSDPANQLKEFDGHTGNNSIVYCYNHTFDLPGYTDARKVFLSGSFNNWQHRQLRMKRYNGGWHLPVFLENGTHFYKYIVDGKWITDPANKDIKPDADGNANSFIGIGDTVLFTLKGYESAEKVILSGNFNNWSWNELTMNKVPGGWELPYVMGPGNYEYKFIVDGKWMPDPDNPCTIGSGDFINSCFTFKPNITFTLSGFTDAQRVIVTGSFNNWNTKAYEMEKVDGQWQYTMFLPAGKHTYKFIVDDSWLIDPANPNWEENALGTGNSVLWVEP